jgi:hypothetical protein
MEVGEKVLKCVLWEGFAEVKVVNYDVGMSDDS